MIQNTREQLIEVASQLFSRKGVDATTMGDIANASDRGRRTIYTYFRNKREVYSAVLQSEADGLLERLGTIVAAEGPVEQRLREFLSVRLVQRRKQNSPAASLRALFKPDLRRISQVRRIVRDRARALLHTGHWRRRQCSGRPRCIVRFHPRFHHHRHLRKKALILAVLSYRVKKSIPGMAI